jgi:iron-sulfur cluster repair protein YtfE (RIC family)
MEPETQESNKRLDIYASPHKCIRHAHCIILTDLGRADFRQKQSDLLARVRLHLKMVAQHLSEENRFIHPALERCAPHATSRLVTQHDEHAAFFERLDGLIADCETAPSADALSAGRELYLTFSQFVGSDLSHMSEEEQATWPLLCAYLTDQEMAEIVQTIAKDYSEEALLYFLPHMAAAVNIQELAAELGGLKAAVPAEAYAIMFNQAVLPSIDEERLDKARDLHLLP